MVRISPLAHHWVRTCDRCRSGRPRGTRDTTGAPLVVPETSAWLNSSALICSASSPGRTPPRWEPGEERETAVDARWTAYKAQVRKECKRQGWRPLDAKCTSHLEWLALYLPDKELREPWVEDAAAALARLILVSADNAIEGGALYHAAHGLHLYHDRVFGDPKAKRPYPLP